MDPPLPPFIYQSQGVLERHHAHRRDQGHPHRGALASGVGYPEAAQRRHRRRRRRVHATEAAQSPFVAQEDLGAAAHLGADDAAERAPLFEKLPVRLCAERGRHCRVGEGAGGAGADVVVDAATLDAVVEARARDLLGSGGRETRKS